MIVLLRQIILCVTAASLFCAVTLSLVPDGALKEVIRMGTGLVLILSLVIPLRQSLPRALTNLLPQVSVPEQQDTTELYQRAVLRQVEAEAAQYAVQRAASVGIDCTASVTAITDEDGTISITAVNLVLDAPASDSIITDLRTQLAQELGITDEYICIM
ncbi:MAG: stage III sporulation protein AF [Clostridia bacterium]|nr:stage III sporulation protein AF [Clostridia bacterium]